MGGIPMLNLIMHDMSKFNPVEFINYAKYYKISKDNKDNFLKGWMHHQKRNKHHPEYWTTVGIFDWSNGSVPMPVVYVREWIADLQGASKEYTGSFDMNEWLKENIKRYDYCHQDTLFEFAFVLQELSYPVWLNEQAGALMYGK